MVVSTVCPACGHRYDVAYRLAGRKVRCKGCASIFRVPVPTYVSDPQDSTSTPGELFEDDESISELDESVMLGGSTSPRSGSSVATVMLWGGVGLVLLFIAWKAGLGQPRWLAFAGCLLVASCMMFARLRAGRQPEVEGVRRISSASVAGGFVAVAAMMTAILLLMDVIPLSPATAPTRLTAADERAARQDALRQKYPGKAVTVLVKGFPLEAEIADAAEERLGQRIGTLAGNAEMAPAGEGDERSYTIAPVDDPDAILKAIDFGQTGRRGLLIDVDLSPAYVASLTETASETALVEGSDEIDAALKDLASDDRARQKSAATRLISLPTVDARKRSVVAALVPLLDSGDDPTAAETIKALSAWQTRESLAVLIDHLKDHRSEIRLLSMKGLARSNDPAAMRAVATRLNDEPEAVATVLLEVGAAAEPAIFPRLSDPDPAQRRKACELLAQLGGVASIEAIQPALSDRDESVRAQAAAALKTIQSRVAAANQRK